MEGSSSSRKGGLGLPTIPPHGGDVPHDPAAKRRAANRQYSERYRRKKHDHVLKLEVQQKSLEEEISVNSPRLEYYKEVKPYIVAESNSLKERLSQVSSNLESKKAQAEALTFDLEELKLIDEVQQAKWSKMKSKGK